MEDFLIEQAPTRAQLDAFTVTSKIWQEAVNYYHSRREKLIDAARFSRDHAVSHRNPPFLVGCAVQAIEPNLPMGEYGVYQAYNFTPKPGNRSGIEKRCAERNALEAAHKWGKAVVAITTVSKEKSTGDTTENHDVLHPCIDCRTMFRSLLTEGFLRPDTVVCNVNDADTQNIKIEETSLGDLLANYPND